MLQGYLLWCPDYTPGIFALVSQLCSGDLSLIDLLCYPGCAPGFFALICRGDYPTKAEIKKHDMPRGRPKGVESKNMTCLGEDPRESKVKA